MRNNRDTHMDASIDTKIPGFVERIAVTSDENGKVPGWMTTEIFFFCTCALMTWPYRWMFNYKTGKTTYEIRKKIFAFPKPSPKNEFSNNPGYYPPSVPPNYPNNAQNYPPNYPDGAVNYPPHYPVGAIN